MGNADHERTCGCGQASDGREGTEWWIRAARGVDIDPVRNILSGVELPVDGVEIDFTDRFAVAEFSCAGGIIGSAGLEVWGSYGLLRSVAVLPGWRRRGIAEALVHDRLRWARERGLEAVFLLSFTPEYFERFGFQRLDRVGVPAEVQRSAEFAHLCPDSAVAMSLRLNPDIDAVRGSVRSRYARIALAAAEGTNAAPQGDGAAAYDAKTLESAPAGAACASLGSGNPLAHADLRPGEIVLDLGSGAGLDAILAARRVGPDGWVYGLDMTEEMHALARRHQEEAGVDNVRFLHGYLEAVPLPDEAVDVVISNCVINLSPDKRRVIAEAARVLKPGGRFVVSDVVARTPVPEALRGDLALWAGCVSGALDIDEYRTILEENGLESIAIEPQADFDVERVDGCGCGGGVAHGKKPVPRFASAIVRARKPESGDRE